MYKTLFCTALFFLIGFFIPSSAAFGEDQVKSLVKEYSYEIGPETRYFNYEEDLMEEKGLMYGVGGGITYHGIAGGQNHLMAGVRLECLGGTLDYDGQTWGGAPVKEDTNDWIFEYRTLIGYDIAWDDTYLFTLFTGIGYRYWNDDIQGSGGYERETKYVYQPIGIKATSNMPGKWRWGASAEYDFFWAGKVQSNLSDANPGFNNPEVNQNASDGYGIKCSFHFTRRMSPTYALTLEPYIRYWDIESSGTELLTLNGTPYAYIFEPANQTTSYGLRVKFVF